MLYSMEYESFKIYCRISLEKQLWNSLSGDKKYLFFSKYFASCMLISRGHIPEGFRIYCCDAWLRISRSIQVQYHPKGFSKSYAYESSGQIPYVRGLDMF
jgi:hypothetical protein